MSIRATAVTTTSQVAVEGVAVELAPAPSSLPVLVAQPSDSHFRRMMDGTIDAAAEHVECCICFEPLHEGQIATLTHRGRNACPHYLHDECARQLLESAGSGFAHQKACPQCRTTIDGCVTVPSIAENPDGWFFCVDAEGDGRLSRQQVVNILVRQWPIDTAKLEEALPTLWERWDQSGSGYVSKEEFLHPQKGLLRFVRATLLGEVCAPTEEQDEDSYVPPSYNDALR